MGFQLLQTTLEEGYLIRCVSYSPDRYWQYI